MLPVDSTTRYMRAESRALVGRMTKDEEGLVSKTKRRAVVDVSWTSKRFGGKRPKVQGFHESRKGCSARHPYYNSLLDIWTREEDHPRPSQHVGLDHHQPWKRAERKQLGQESSDPPQRRARIWHQPQRPRRRQRRDRRVPPPQQTRSRAFSSAESKEVNPKAERLWKTRHKSRKQP